MRNLCGFISRIFIISLFIFTGCSKESAPEPSVSFEMDKTDAGVGEMITFTNTSQYATTFKWDFDDGTTSTEENPIHSYTDFGNYRISLTANGEGGSGFTSRPLIIWDIVLTSIFYGDSCEFQGPVTFKSQPVKLEFYNQSSYNASPNLVKHDEGYSHQDMLNLFVDGISYGHHPAWTTEIADVWHMISAYESRNWVGTLEPGLYTLVNARQDPYCVWYLAGLTVTDE